MSSVMTFICTGHAQVHAVEWILVFDHGDPVYESGDLSGVCKQDHTPLHKASMLLVHRRLCTIFRVLVQSCPLLIVDFDAPVHDLRQCVVLCTRASICLAGVAGVCSQLGATRCDRSFTVRAHDTCRRIDVCVISWRSDAAGVLHVGGKPNQYGVKQGKIGFVKGFKVEGAGRN